jgi:hypothetical protein
MTRRSMARFGAACLAFVACCSARSTSAEETSPHESAPLTEATPSEPAPYRAWQSPKPHAPPPPIVQDLPPAPELLPPEYARRPFELTPELLFSPASCADGTLTDTRCAGLTAGPGWGGTLLWRASPYFAMGGAMASVGFAFHPSPNTGLWHTSASGLFLGLLGRVYFADHGPVEPYLELGFGGGSVTTSAREASDVQYAETAAGSAVRVGGAVEFFLSRRVRLGPAFDWTRFDASELRRCGASTPCVELDQARTGHARVRASVRCRSGSQFCLARACD